MVALGSERVKILLCSFQLIDKNRNKNAFAIYKKILNSPSCFVEKTCQRVVRIFYVETATKEESCNERC